MTWRRSSHSLPTYRSHDAHLKKLLLYHTCFWKCRAQTSTTHWHTPAIITLPLRLADRLSELYSSLKVGCMHESPCTLKWPTKLLSNYFAEEITAHQSTDKPTKWLRNPQTETFTDLLFKHVTDKFTGRLVYNYLSCSWKSTSSRSVPIWNSEYTVKSQVDVKKRRFITRLYEAHIRITADYVI